MGEARDAGFDEWFLTLLPKVIRVTQRMTGDRAAAEDVAAEAFARAFARWSKVGSLPHRDAWVMRVASNLAIDAGRRKPRWSPAPSDAVDPADSIAVRAALVEALSRLPKSQRDAVVLRYLADLSEADVAAAMRVRPGTVKSNVHRASAALRASLGIDLEVEALGNGAH